MAVPYALPKICVSIGHRSASRFAALALESCDHGETFIELRIDMLADPSAGRKIVKRILRRHPDVTILATCRRQGNGGDFLGSVDQQVAVLRHAVQAGASIVDLELETLEQDCRSLEPFAGKASTLASYHNFERTPQLGPVVRRLERTGANIYKVATTVRRPSDNLKLLALCDSHSNMVLAGMGPSGAPTRLLSPSRGGLFTYAAPDPLAVRGASRRTPFKAEPTAPGQLLASDMRRLYRVPTSRTATKAFAVIAKPVGHSLSPLIHNRAFKARRFDGIYVPLQVEPGHLRNFFETMRELPFSGASVTIPHKQGVIRYLDSLCPLARGIGAVNTIYWKRGKLLGTNTDALGVSGPLGRLIKLNSSRVLVVGNGGAAKAAIVAVKQQGADVTVTGRDPRRVLRLARFHGVRHTPFERLGDDYFDVLIQSTPVGMLPKVEGNLFPERIPADIVYDLVYNPLETALLKHAAAEGKVVISGVEMFVEQAAEQFQIWTGLDAPRELMRTAVLQRTVN